jgi:hypothetical protein
VFTEAYRYDLHIQFANARTDQELIGFLRAWGPLWLSDAQKEESMASYPISRVRAFQRWLKAVMGLLAAFKSAHDERIALREFLEAEREKEDNSPAPAAEPISWMILKSRFEIAAAVPDWVSALPLEELRIATDLILRLVVLLPITGEFVFRRRHNRGEIEARWAISDLEEALSWMVWYDEFTRHPLICCQECRKVFRGTTAHARKYCSQECAHRATAREWQRRKRASSRTSSKKSTTRRK